MSSQSDIFCSQSVHPAPRFERDCVAGVTATSLRTLEFPERMEMARIVGVAGGKRWCVDGYYCFHARLFRLYDRSSDRSRYVIRRFLLASGRTAGIADASYRDGGKTECERCGKSLPDRESFPGGDRCARPDNRRRAAAGGRCRRSAEAILDGASDTSTGGTPARTALGFPRAIELRSPLLGL